MSSRLKVYLFIIFLLLLALLVKAVHFDPLKVETQEEQQYLDKAMQEAPKGFFFSAQVIHLRELSAEEKQAYAESGDFKYKVTLRYYLFKIIGFRERSFLY